MDLFDRRPRATEARRQAAPLADRMRPRSLEEVVGQRHVVGEGAFLRQVLAAGQIPSLVLWGPPGTGKTTIARLLAQASGARMHALSAVAAGVKEVREAIAGALDALRYDGRRTLLFVDEIHRFHKGQQDALLGAVEDGTVTLVGATTENPSFEVNAALLSRLRVVLLEPLGEDDLARLLARALADAERGLGAHAIDAEPAALAAIAGLAGGDARAALNLLDLAAAPLTAAPADARILTTAAVGAAARRRTLLHDKSGDRHYDLISALHKAIRQSDPQAALYWLARLLEGGDDPVYVARRLCRIASEDVGLADPRALEQANAAANVVRLVGMPEGDVALAQAAVYLALAPKSDAVYRAYGAAREDVRERPAYAVPLFLRNAPTPLLEELGCGEGYLPAHLEPDGIGRRGCLPADLAGRRYYEPSGRGVEARLGERLREIERIRAEAERGHQERADDAPPPDPHEESR